MNGIKTIVDYMAVNKTILDYMNASNPILDYIIIRKLFLII